MSGIHGNGKTLEIPPENPGIILTFICRKKLEDLLVFSSFGSDEIRYVEEPAGSSPFSALMSLDMSKGLISLLIRLISDEIRYIEEHRWLFSCLNSDEIRQIEELTLFSLAQL